jgi:hypothetical protein
MMESDGTSKGTKGHTSFKLRHLGKDFCLQIHQLDDSVLAVILKHFKDAVTWS